MRLADHQGYSGQVGIGLPAESTECSIYYANNTLEVMYPKYSPLITGCVDGSRYRVSTYLARYRKMALSLASLVREDLPDEPLLSGSLSARNHHSFIGSFSNSINESDHKFFDLDDYSGQGKTQKLTSTSTPNTNEKVGVHCLFFGSYTC